MITIQRMIAAGALALVLCANLYEARVIARQNAELRVLQQQTAKPQRILRSLRTERDGQARQLARIRELIAAERAKIAANALSSADPDVVTAMNSWLRSAAYLKQRLEIWPNEKIPELQFLTPEDWLDAARELKTDSDMDVRRALSRLRRVAKDHFAPQLALALQRYLAANNHQPPGDATLLASYSETPVDPALLQRYGAIPADLVGSLPRAMVSEGKNEQWLFCDKPVDDYYDSTYFLGASGAVLTYWGSSKFDKEVEAAIKTFQTAHNGQRPTEAAQLAPYLHSSIDPEFVQQKLGNTHR